MGTAKYSKIIRTDRLPCKICKPVYNEHSSFNASQEDNRWLDTDYVDKLPPEEANAVKRQKDAAIERKRLSNKPMTESQRKDFLVLTQPRFAFWTGCNSRLFHIRCCESLNNMSGFNGYSSYSKAVKAGYSPCPLCNPSQKYDITVSIPINNRVRSNECISSLEPRCKNAGFTNSYDGDYFCVETPVGKWRIDKKSKPIKMEHINLYMNSNETNYHHQPRLFLSFADAFNYIKSHDRQLVKCASISVN